MINRHRTIRDRAQTIVALGLLIAVLAACRPAPNPNIITWTRAADTIIFRADVTGGDQDAISALNDLPRCTIYGDNRVVWVNELGGFGIEVLQDRLDDTAIARFVSYLTVNERIYTYNTIVRTPVPDVQPVIERITLNVNGALHTTDSNSGWDEAWFGRVINACAALSSTPILFVPDGAWLIAIPTPYDINAPASGWDAPDVRLAAIAAAGQPVWAAGASVAALWDTIHTAPPNILFVENGIYYRVALQVPGVSRDAPPAPAS
jgi:hypothetical protein